MREKLKADESMFRQATKKITFEPIKDLETNSKVIAEFFKVYKEFKENDKIRSMLFNAMGELQARVRRTGTNCKLRMQRAGNTNVLFSQGFENDGIVS